MDRFAADVFRGLSGKPKFLPPKYFYDEEGSRIFTNITAVKEYYPTRCEYEIFQLFKDEILRAIISLHKKFQLIEFGAGDGMKTKLLLEHFIEEEADFTYIPVDICKEENEFLKEDLTRRYPGLKVEPVTGDFIECLKMPGRTGEGKIILFLGSTIGNLPHEETVEFLRSLHANLNSGDLLLTGFDLKKHPKLIADAYNDSEGYTKAFNLNLLKRINRELEGNFDLGRFEHYPVYDPQLGEARSYLVSCVPQKVMIKKLDQEFHFDEGEVIFTEISRKFSIEDIQLLASETGFKPVENFTDTKRYFVDSLWMKS